jgi:hypothetical protein
MDDHYETTKVCGRIIPVIRTSHNTSTLPYKIPDRTI